MAKDDFEFRIDAKITRVTDEEILDSLHTFAKRRNFRPFTTRDYNRW